MRPEHENKSPFGRGFVTACVVVSVVLLCGVLLLVSTLTSDDDQQAAAQTAPPAAASTTPDTEPAAAGDGRCGLPEGDQTIPTKPPAVDSWEVSRRVVVPRSSAAGPARTDPDGFRHCFAHSPTGAVFAAYNVVAAFADQEQALATIKKLVVPGPDADALTRAQSESEPSGSGASQVAGFRVLDAGGDRATIMLALPVESAYASITLTMRWYDGDWRLQSPPPGEAVGDPISQHRDLSDFVPWSGV
ncbi:hypothetical protein E0H73_31315 [Kribbella pittospori]|uniref:DUF8175 domain-containing protein n=1 Tax=Kribbella pittospori TaxID=722689 RepID=A0A4R0K9R9_9ACTN|nr:hypothetical protein [Kribbella pittospori]TCC56981.1 hypothetical protein E0H73_31315 [Kribbella pittospori]